MKIAEVMTRDVRTIGPDRSVRDAARIMDEMNVGVLPVCDGRRLLGMLTDRDIAIRAVAQGRGPDTKVREAMTPEVRYCFEDEDLDAVVRNMGENKVRRLSVLGRDERLVGIVSLGDVALYGDSDQTDAVAAAVSEPGGPHTQAG